MTDTPPDSEVDPDRRPWAPETCTYDQLFDVVRHRRMVYDFSGPDGDVTEEDVTAVLEAARWAPSGHNSQPWEFVVVRERERLDALADVLRTQRDWVRSVDDDFPSHGRVYLDQVPVAIVVLGDWRARNWYPETPKWHPGEWDLVTDIYHESMGCCMQNIHLAAKARGLGTVHVSVHRKYAEEITELLEIPDHMVVHNVVPLGVPDRDAGQNMTREPLEANLHRETYDPEKATSDADLKAELDDPQARSERMHGTPDG